MRRTSILLEFSDEVYDTLVEPLKKTKSFTKLVGTLIDGYMQDSYVRAYADDSIDGMRNQAVSEFNNSIDSMNATLSEMGLITDELESTSVGGRDFFKKKSTAQSKELHQTYNSQGTAEVKEELDEVKRRMDDMQSSLQGMVSLLTEALKSGSIAVVQGAGADDKLSEPDTVGIIDEAKVTKPVEVEEVVDVEENAGLVAASDDDEDEEVSEADVKEANSFLMNMLDGNSFEF